MKGACKQIQTLSEEEIALLGKNPIDYYRAKVEDNFQFNAWGDEDSPSSQAAAEQKEDPLELELPYVKEESSKEENESAAGDKDQSNNNNKDSSDSSSSSGSESSRNKEQSNAADLKR